MVLRLITVLLVSVVSGKQAFRKMALIKNKLSSTMGEDRENQNHLLILSIEDDMVRSIDFKNVIDDFAKVKSRKVFL